MNRFLIVLAVLVILFIHNNQGKEHMSAYLKTYTIWKKNHRGDTRVNSTTTPHVYNLRSGDHYLKADTATTVSINGGRRTSLLKDKILKLPRGTVTVTLH
jgi:hypothetical protein